jgi:PAS domain S-box-containing protein
MMNPLFIVGSLGPFLLYFAVIFFSACSGSLSAFYATISCCASALIFVLPWHLNQKHHAIWLSVVLFAVEGLMLSALFRMIEIIQRGMRDEEARLRQLVEQNPEGFLTADENGVITYVCSSVEKILGYKPDEIKGTPLHILVHPSEQKEFEFKFIKLLNGKSKSVMFLQRLKKSNDDWIWVEGCVNNMLRVEPVRSIVLNYRNVTDRINKNKQQEDFVHMASHELKTPIAAVKGFSQLLRFKHNKEGRKQDLPLIERIDIQLDRLLGLIDDMLNMTRIRAGEMHYHREWFDLGACVREVVDAVMATGCKHQIRVAVPDRAIRVHADRNRISQVIINLLTNAIKYSPDADLVDLKVELQPEEVRLEITDYGIGIPAENQAHIFERFYRVDGENREKVNGLGLGLFIAKDVVDKHEGKIGLNSEPGKGSTFWFSLQLL